MYFLVCYRKMQGTLAGLSHALSARLTGALPEPGDAASVRSRHDKGLAPLTDHPPAPVKSGLSDEELAIHPTVFAPDALKQQVVVISGGAGGIGRAIAFLFARLGAHVVIVGRDKSKLDIIVTHLANRNLKATAHAADIRDPDAVAATFDTAWDAHGRVDSLINSAGGQFPQDSIDFSIKGWNAVIDTNLNGT